MLIGVLGTPTLCLHLIFFFLHSGKRKGTESLFLSVRKLYYQKRQIQNFRVTHVACASLEIKNEIGNEVKHVFVTDSVVNT